MDKRFSGQVAVVTGGADGLGKSISKRLADEGATVVIVDADEHKLNATLEEFGNEELAISGFSVDISDEESVKQAFTKVAQRYGKLDVLINSAGIVGPTSTPITEYNTAQFDRIYGVNLRGAFLVTKYGVGLMEKNSYGRILLIASIAGKEGNPNMVGYSATKAGVIGLVKAVGKEYATKGITVNGLAPAVIKTAMNADTAPDQLTYMTDKIPMGRLGTVDEVAAIATWIVSPEASFSTGFVFDISGGRATY
ncbi:SDR family NAD(P)-dependent oxidoreductase [Parapedobacter sp. 10938]|uniref:SDR family NAD(P)-dependent oxidoreductase n=1 Tax=Parapedobacter flavus TaxID=3110225 RepID=UPI002DC05B85|nr:SDR family NAD(P)-dependent oxidoreductase [Parapedobacter sp. 10938]MEC3878509.1 SDR family NAD(P)-dependent oxidoreductase [Parapedobacter sp. 10938]